MHFEIPGTVLIVDHAAHMRGVVVEMIEKNMGLSCAEANMGEKALRYLQSSDGAAVRVVLLDLSLPDIEGMALLQRIKAMTPWMPVIVMTENRDVDHAVCTIQSGADDFLMKPVLESRLVAAVKNAIDKGKMLREIDDIRARGGGEERRDDGLHIMLCDDAGAVKHMADLESEIAKSVLEHCGGNVSKAAKALGLARSTFYRKLKGQ